MVLSQCTNIPKNEAEGPTLTFREKFNRDFTELFSEFEDEMIVRPSVLETKEPFEFLKHIRTLKTNFLDLNYSLYTIDNSCGGCYDFQVIYIYNDTLTFVLPVWDGYYYRSNACNQSLDSIDNSLSMLKFEIFLKRLIRKVALLDSSKDTSINIIRSINILSNSPEFTYSDVCSIESLLDNIEDASSLLNNPKCINALTQSIPELQEISRYTRDDILIFGSLICIQYFKIIDSEELFEYKVFNHECTCTILM